MRLAYVAIGLCATACGRLGFDARPELDAGSEDDTLVSSYVPSASITGSVFVEVPEATVTFRPGAADEAWLVWVSAELSSSSLAGEEFTVEARYLVNGEERGFGGVTTTGSQTFGSWQHFVLVTDVTDSQVVTVELRDQTAPSRRQSLSFGP